MDNPTLHDSHMNTELLHGPITQEMLSHITSCEDCAQQFSDYVEKEAFVRAPHDLRDSIMQRSRQMDVQTVIKSNQLSKRLQLFYYSLKVGAAVFGSLVILSLTPFTLQFVSGRLTEQTYFHAGMIYEQAKSITDHMNEISTQLLQMEVLIYDKKEK